MLLDTLDIRYRWLLVAGQKTGTYSKGDRPLCHKCEECHRTGGTTKLQLEQRRPHGNLVRMHRYLCFPFCFAAFHVPGSALSTTDRLSLFLALNL